jgi:hypothetical protein
MDRRKIIDALGLVPGGGLSVIDMQMEQWGRNLIFACLYRVTPFNTAPDEPVHFSLVFRDCREIKYRVYAHIGEHEQGQVTSIADIAEISLGRGHHNRDANILTNHFSISVSYGEVAAETEDAIYILSD